MKELDHFLLQHHENNSQRAQAKMNPSYLLKLHNEVFNIQKLQT